ncbi:MAG: Rieske 2Fe-2S domain-containing protein [Phycisphaerae bacterium]|nr:Rieske 2Fe-2S domain-containing protein [Phycisphaerae bacterium]
MSEADGHPGQWVDLCPADAVEPGTARTVIIGDHPYAVCNDAGRFAVVDNTCPHAGGNLGEGVVRAGRIVCPWHRYEWHLATGLSFAEPFPRRLRVYPAKVEAGRVLALIDGNSPNPR